MADIESSNGWSSPESCGAASPSSGGVTCEDDGSLHSYTDAFETSFSPVGPTYVDDDSLHGDESSDGSCLSYSHDDGNRSINALDVDIAEVCDSFELYIFTVADIHLAFTSYAC